MVCYRWSARRCIGGRTMEEVTRLSMSLPRSLATRFQHYAKERGYANRSEALRDLIRHALVQEEWKDPNAAVAATLTLVYDHHTRTLKDKITAIQHDAGPLVVSTLHVHLDHHNCLEVVVLRGKAKEVQHVADRIAALRGIKHAQLSATTEGKQLV